MHRIKSYGQNEIQSHIMAISFVFLPYFCPKMATPEEALPNGPQSSSLYFWNQWKQENRNNLQANSKSNFLIFCPPLMYMVRKTQLLGCLSFEISRIGIVHMLVAIQLTLNCNSNPNFQTIQTSNLALWNDPLFDCIRTPPSYQIGLMFPEKFLYDQNFSFDVIVILCS